jgi:hypothetical protein
MAKAVDDVEIIIVPLTLMEKMDDGASQLVIICIIYLSEPV